MLQEGKGGRGKPGDCEDVTEKLVFARGKFACGRVMEEKREEEGGRGLDGCRGGEREKEGI